MLPNEDTVIAAKPDPYIGKIIDKYKLIEKLGAGGMGLVYRAEQARIKRHVAIKLLPYTLVNDEVNVKRIEREATAMGNLRHPNIATMYDFGVAEDGQPYLVMELISGKSLGQLLLEHGHLDASRSLKILRQAAEAMEYAHKNGIIHRDLKPDNIMLDCEHTDDFVKILDFGIAKSVDNVVNLSQSLTRPGTVVGSPLYMSPEQCMGQKLDAGTDIYSLGVIMYEMLTGEIPCKGATIYETIGKKTTEAPPPFPPQFAGLADLESLARACLAPMRSDRPESMQTVHDRLAGLMSGTIDLAKPVVEDFVPPPIEPTSVQSVIVSTPEVAIVHQGEVERSQMQITDPDSLMLTSESAIRSGETTAVDQPMFGAATLVKEPSKFSVGKVVAAGALFGAVVAVLFFASLNHDLPTATKDGAATDSAAADTSGMSAPVAVPPVSVEVPIAPVKVNKPPVPPPRRTASRKPPAKPHHAPPRSVTKVPPTAPPIQNYEQPYQPRYGTRQDDEPYYYERPIAKHGRGHGNHIPPGQQKKMRPFEKTSKKVKNFWKQLKSEFD